MFKLFTALFIFLICYAIIIAETMPSYIIAMIGASSMVIFGVFGSEEYATYIDIDVIALLIGMMIMVNIVSETGLFEWIAIKIAKFVKGRPFPLLILISFVTAILSAFLDNVTTIMVLTPVTIFLAKSLGISPIPFVISQTIASNIGGAATMMGDPPNLLIASNSNFSFNDFIYHLTPIAVINMGIFFVLCWVFFNKDLKVSRHKRAMLMSMDSSKAIVKPRKLIISLSIFSLVILGFLLHDILHISISSISICGAAFMMIATKTNAEKAISKIEWGTIMFFVGLFVMVGGISSVGVLTIISEYILKLTRGSVELTSMSLLWMSSIVSSVLDNIPYTATISPMVSEYIIPYLKSNSSLSYEQIKNAIWWSLSLGACLGGNGTLIGASANIVGTNIAKKNGYEISFLKFTRYGIVFTFFTTLASSIYVWFRYLQY